MQKYVKHKISIEIDIAFKLYVIKYFYFQNNFENIPIYSIGTSKKNCRNAMLENSKASITAIIYISPK